MRIAFFDLPFHAQTQSSAFFLRLIESIAEVSCFHLVSETHINLESGRPFLFEDYECIVIFQFSPILFNPLLRQHTNVVLVPMLDHVYASGTPYWKPLWHGIKVISFSKALHNLVIATGGDSFYVQYFLEPEGQPEAADNVGRDAYFWERRKDIDAAVVVAVLKNFDIYKLTVHQSPDPGHTGSDAKHFLAASQSMKQTQWYESHTDFLTELRAHQIFIAPRPYEGIGLVLLEAMSSGLCVIAPDTPTHNEYIVHGVNGLLYDLNRPVVANADVRALGRAARDTHVEGRKMWLQGLPGLIDFIVR